MQSYSVQRLAVASVMMIMLFAGVFDSSFGHCMQAQQPHARTTAAVELHVAMGPANDFGLPAMIPYEAIIIQAQPT
jgi:hypothetical protein